MNIQQEPFDGGPCEGYHRWIMAEDQRWMCIETGQVVPYETFPDFEAPEEAMKTRYQKIPITKHL